MGGSPTKSLWNDKELDDIEKVEKIQKKSFEFVIKHFYENVPLRFGRKSLDPISPMWIEPSPSIINDEENQVSIILLLL